MCQPCAEYREAYRKAYAADDEAYVDWLCGTHAGEASIGEANNKLEGDEEPYIKPEAETAAALPTIDEEGEAPDIKRAKMELDQEEAINQEAEAHTVVKPEADTFPVADLDRDFPLIPWDQIKVETGEDRRINAPGFQQEHKEDRYNMPNQSGQKRRGSSVGTPDGTGNETAPKRHKGHQTSAELIAQMLAACRQAEIRNQAQVESSRRAEEARQNIPAVQACRRVQEAREAHITSLRHAEAARLQQPDNLDNRSHEPGGEVTPYVSGLGIYSADGGEGTGFGGSIPY